MAVDREQSISHINRHMTEWFKALEANNEKTIERRCRELLAGKNKLSKVGDPEFIACMLKVKKETWENYLRRCRDKKYEKGRGRISVSKSTQEQLDELRKKLDTDSYDILIVRLIDVYKKANRTKNSLLKPKKK